MPAKTPPEGYVSIATAAKMAGVCAMTMRGWVVDRGDIPYMSVTSGMRTFYFLRKTDVLKLVDSIRPKTRHHYEIVLINLGELTVLYDTYSLRELSVQYTHMMERGHKLVRVRVDGELLTIHESDKLGNAYHPRTRKGATA